MSRFQSARSPAEAAVLRAHSEFYAAFNAMDLSRMSTCWAGEDSDACVHPGWEILVGWLEVRESWRAIFAGLSFARLHAEVVTLDVRGETARVCCVENMMMITHGLTSHSQVAATNLFEHIDGEWRVVMHHGSPMAHSITDDSEGPDN